MQADTKQTSGKRSGFFKKIFSGSGWALFTMFVWELVEEGLENLIAMAISSGLALFLTKALSTLAIITATQGVNVALKRFLLPVVKNFTYKEGNDKMSKLKKFFLAIWANKKTILGTISSAVMVASGSGVIDVSGLPEVNIGSFNIIPLIYYLTLGVFAVLGVFGKGPEKIKAFFDRINALKAEKEEKAIIKEAQEELDAETKLANQTQAEQEKAAAEAQAKAEAEAEKAAAEAEHKAKVDAAKAKILAEKAEAAAKAQADAQVQNKAE